MIAVAVLVVGGTIAYFIDTETSENTAGAATFDISDEGTWTKNYSFTDMYPGQVPPKEIDFTLRNVGSSPMRVWMVIKNVSNEENGISDSEQDWYDDYGVKNDLDEAIAYGLKVDGNLALELEAEVTVSEIKEHYVNLVKTDKPFATHDGILKPGETIDIEQGFYLLPGTENWAQSDIMNIEIEILAQQVDAQEPIKQLSYMQNKFTSGDWHIISDERVGVLRYDSSATEFNYDFIGKGLASGTDYNLIYYPDPWGNPKPVLVLSNVMTADGEGEINNIGQSLDTGDMPTISDDNHPYGAKIWLVTSDKLLGSKTAGDTNNLGWSGTDDWLFDGWPGLIRYEKSSNGSSGSAETVHFADLGESPQFGPDHDYSTANVSFTYDTPANDKLSGTITATGIKPDMTYQIKFIGKPTCHYPTGDDDANERIGYKGRWTVLGTSCSGAGCNRSDTQYEANKALPDGDPNKECIAGCLIWDYVTADGSGAVTKTIETANSYHVLWCGGGTCGHSNNSQLVIQDPYPICAETDVNGQIERFSCNGLVLDEQVYDLEIVLNEESFHQSSYGTWTAVMATDIDFEIE